jgi:hypothetical protein
VGNNNWPRKGEDMNCVEEVDRRVIELRKVLSEIMM